MSTRAAHETSQQLAGVEEELHAILQEMLELERRAGQEIEAAGPAWRSSAQNLVHYIALRQRDVRALQELLTRLGLSSLGRSEGHIRWSVQTLLSVVTHLAGRERPELVPCLDIDSGRKLLVTHADELLGPLDFGGLRASAAANGEQSRSTRIMVTMPSEGASDPTMVRTMIERGMDIMRINCAHDTPVAWERMIEHLRAAEVAVGRRCRVYMDIAGPKVRTGPIERRPGELKVVVERKAGGQRVPRRIRMMLEREVRGGVLSDAFEPTLPVEGLLLKQLQTGSVITLIDVRGKRRKLEVTSVDSSGAWVLCNKTTVFRSGMELHLRSDGQGRGETNLGLVVQLPKLEQSIELEVGDRLILTRDQSPGRPAAAGHPARIPCTLEEVFRDVRPDERAILDDGKISARVETVGSDEILLHVTRARPGGVALRADKGINWPDTALNIQALTPADRQNLAFIAKHADIVGFSFVQHERDVAELAALLKSMDASHVGIVLKIETRRAFENLPALLLAGLRSPPLGVMIARGDLAVECGYERLAEVQEEILWMCEAAHVPVIWATQVLENLAKKGAPTRAEVTDAAMSERAECVMLNKGPYIAEAVSALDNILTRMSAHQRKKRPMMRPLRVAQGFGRTGTG